MCEMPAQPVPRTPCCQGRRLRSDVMELMRIR